MTLIILISRSRASCSTTAESLSLVATQMLLLTKARFIFSHAHANFGLALAGAITPSRPTRVSRCINISSLPMLVPKAHSPSRTSCFTDTELLSLLVHQMLALPAPAHATDMLSLSVPLASPRCWPPSATALTALSTLNAHSPPKLNMLRPLKINAYQPPELSMLVDLANNSPTQLFYGLAAPSPTQLFYWLAALFVFGHLLSTQFKMQIDLAYIPTLVSGNLLDTQIELQIDLADITTLVSGHLLDTQIKLPIDLPDITAQAPQLF
mmetsp:Transcript_45375/g.106128  ORF Transcript_45375/g.106128 Transcript_45375/m.106128 type:complete len:267 (+) Transcript_45375:183-983(+)